MPRASKTPPPEPSPGWVRKTLFQPRVLIALAIVGAAMLLTPYLRHWLPVLEELPEYRFETARMQVSTPNRWVPRDFVKLLVDQDRLPAEVSLLEPGLAERIATALAAEPWVKEVVAVRITRSGISADLKYRVPVLLIEGRTGMYPVDRDSTLLPPTDFAVSDLNRFPRLKGIVTTPAGPAGTLWNDTVVLGGARLAEVLVPDGDMTIYWDRFQLEAIEAPPRATATLTLADISYELITRGRSRIVWGRAPGADDLEPSVAQKLGRLETYFTNHGGFESQTGPSRIDIRPFEMIDVSALESPSGARQR